MSRTGNNTAKRLWGIHTKDDNLFLKQGKLAIGWHEMGDLNAVANNREAFKVRYQTTYPDAKKGSIAASAGILYRFCHEAQIGDYVVYPSKSNRMVNIGEIVGHYEYDPSQPEYVHTRDVKWIKSLPREAFSQGALYELGAFMSFFAITSYTDEFMAALEDGFEDFNPSIEDNNTIDTLSDDSSSTVRYWMYTVFDDESWKECQKKEIMVIGCDAIGDYMQYDSKEALRQALMKTYKGDSSRIMQALMTWCFSRVIKPNDVIIAKRANTLVGRGIVTGDYLFDESRSEYKNVRPVRWQQVGNWEHPGKAVAKRLTDISPYTEYLKTLNAIFGAENVDEEEDVPEISYPPYSSEDFLREVFMSRKNYETLVGVLKNKKNIILQGAPGVGKTFAAKRLAYSIMGEKDRDRVMMVQFHQSYSYEDFIMGYRPTDTGFELRKGSFYNFCKQAEEDSDRDYFFIIDEINRGNLSKIFGELFMLIETDKRGIELQLLYSDERFSVPKNLYIIGMMNTADRSLAMLDYALRRRFAFIELEPGFETVGFKAYRMGLASERFDRLITCVERLNDAISTDESLGEGFRIGHSYFCNLTKEKVNGNTLSEIIEFEIIPLLKEYWFDEPTKVRNWSDELRSVVR